MKITEYLKNNIVYLDGGMGTLLQKEGLKPGEHPELWNIKNPQAIINIHKNYFDAGSNVVNTNTFGANLLKFSEDELDKIVKSAIDNAKKAAELSKTDSLKWVALDIGPLGRMLKPYGDLDFNDAVETFKETVKLGVKYGADLVFIETMNDLYETKAALLAVKEVCDLPVFVSNAYSEDGRLMTGADPLSVISLLEGMGADAIGMNCSFGPKELAKVCEKYLEYSSTPIILKPNAGLPKSENGKAVYDVLPDEFSTDVLKLVEKGVRCVGGCCGTTYEYIKATYDKTKDIKVKEITDKNISVVSSYSKSAILGNKPLLIGERINPTGKKRFKEALKENDINYILNEGLSQEEKGVHILDVNVGLPDINEEEMLVSAVKELQAVTALPLQIDTSDPVAMEKALRIYNGKAMINSVNGKAESMEAVFPLQKKYGGVVVALTLDETGIPETAEGRVEIAKKILGKAAQYGISKKDIIFDPLALTISSDKNAAKETLKAVKIITDELKCNTSLGVSNVSFGLPKREIINSNFFSMALLSGLSAAIMNPYSSDMLKAYYSYLALSGMDDNCMDYISFASDLTEETKVEVKKEIKAEISGESNLENAIIKGLKDQAASYTDELLKTEEPLSIVHNYIIPALDKVGVGFEKKEVYLPGLLMSAEAAKCAFEKIKNVSETGKKSDKCICVIATVKGDIHDIGKNIVKLLLENYGFNVVDLGKDVDPEIIVEKVKELKAPVLGLSALMTTTVPSMEETIKLIKEEAPWCRVVVGGAVLNQEYSDMIGADKYAKDAMETVRYAEDVNCK